MPKEKRENKNPKKIIKILIIIFILIVILSIIFLFVLNPKSKQERKNREILENPLSQIISKNTNTKGEIDKEKIIEEGTANFNGDYIDYILLSSGVDKLHESNFGYGKPATEIILNGETWSSYIDNGILITKKSSIDGEDFKVITTKEEIVNALLSEDPEEYLKNSFKSGRIQAELVSGKIELFSKGYLEFYNDLN
mgnify:CR=1 FL=1